MTIAIEMRKYGGPAVLCPVERPAPAPGPGEVVVRNLVAGVNRADCFIRSGEWPHAGEWPYVPGLEACGTVEQVGEGVTGFRAGDRVITAMQKLGGIHGHRPGGYQDAVLVPGDTLARIPEGMDPETAGILGLPAITAVLAMRLLAVEPGMRVLVHAGSSAVGLMAIQLAKRAGARVIATGTRPAKFPVMEEAGAERCVATGDPAWATAAGPVERVFDLVGRATFAATVGLLAPEGKLIFVGGTTGAELSLSGWDLMRPVTITGYSSETLTAALIEDAMREVAGLPPIEVHRFPLHDAAEAHRALESGAHAGRFVLIPRT